MSDQSDRITQLLVPFGLSPEEAKIYLHLLEKGPETALQLSRQLHLARTRVYRLLDKLIAKGLASQELGEMGSKFIANSYHQLELLAKQKEHEAQALKESIPMIFGQLKELVAVDKTTSRVLYYTGLEGLKQVTWNSLKAKDELLIYEIADMSAFLDYGFCEKVREEFVRRKVDVRELTNLAHLPAWTKITEFVRKNWRVRYISPKFLKMKFEVIIYNDVYAMYHFRGDDIFCVEVYNDNLAAMQKQLFDFVWQRAKKMKILNKEGKARVAKEE